MIWRKGMFIIVGMVGLKYWGIVIRVMFEMKRLIGFWRCDGMILDFYIGLKVILNNLVIICLIEFFIILKRIILIVYNWFLIIISLVELWILWENSVKVWIGMI